MLFLQCFKLRVDTIPVNGTHVTYKGSNVQQNLLADLGGAVENQVSTTQLLFS